MKYIDAEKLIKSVNNYLEGAKAALNPIDGDADYYKGKIDTCENIQEIIASLQKEQPDNEDIDKVAQELYEHLYELKRRNNVPTNLYDKQEIIALWKAGIEYAYNHPKQVQPEKSIEINGIRYKEVPAKTNDKICKDCDYFLDNGSCILDACPCACDDNILERIHQEQPEVELEAEKPINLSFDSSIKVMWALHSKPIDKGFPEVATMLFSTFEKLARHFYELGLNARKEE